MGAGYRSKCRIPTMRRPPDSGAAGLHRVLLEHLAGVRPAIVLQVGPDDFGERDTELRQLRPELLQGWPRVVSGGEFVPHLVCRPLPDKTEVVRVRLFAVAVTVAAELGDRQEERLQRPIPADEDLPPLVAIPASAHPGSRRRCFLTPT